MKSEEDYIEEIVELRTMLREIYDVWAGSEGLVTTTAQEAYQAHLIKDMRDIAASLYIIPRTDESI